MVKRKTNKLYTVGIKERGYDDNFDTIRIRASNAREAMKKARKRTKGTKTTAVWAELK